MPDDAQRRLPLRPSLEQLRKQAKDLLRLIRKADPGARELLEQLHPLPPRPDAARLADAQLTLARAYGEPSWPRMVTRCELVEAIWQDDITSVQRIIEREPDLLHENAIARNRNWGPPMSFAANLGRQRITDLLHAMGAKDHLHAIGRAVLRSKIDQARNLLDKIGNPQPPKDALGGPAYTLSVSGTALLFELGAQVYDEAGSRLAPVDVVLCSDSRNPAAKHAILEMYAEHGFRFPDTPVMAVHRGRLDLLEAHLERDPGLLTRTFRHEEIFPAELGCGREVDTQGTTLDGATLLHLCVDWDELEIARWLLARGMPADAPAAVDADGIGGHTALFAAVVSYANFWANYDNYGPPSRADDGAWARLLLDHGADPNAHASLRQRTNAYHNGPRIPHEQRDATPISWGRDFPYQLLVSKRCLQLITDAGGHP